jgi:hypothetical protein
MPRLGVSRYTENPTMQPTTKVLEFLGFTFRKLSRQIVLPTETRRLTLTTLSGNSANSATWIPKL